MIHLKLVSLNLVLSLVLLTSTSVMAQETPSQPELKPETVENLELELTAVEQLKDVQESLKEKRSDRRKLAQEINSAGNSASQELVDELAEVDAEIELLNKTFEQIATGGIDLSVFGIQDKKFDWREELILVVKPLIENIKGLTEKPRKIESLKRVISDKLAAKESSITALKSVEKLREKATEKELVVKLESVKSEWQGTIKDLDREVQLAQYQLDSLEGRGASWYDAFKQGSLNFVQGRGLTLLLVALVALVVWSLMRGILFLFRKRTAESKDRSSKVQYRLAAYAYRLLTGLMIAIGIMMVLYIRRDLLMLAIVVIIFIGAALALKNLLPQYITEGRILLNMGGIRENERVIYNGIPWEVSSINMFSRFANPALKGSLRLPIGQMHSMVSRPAYDEPWFPSSEGDWILDESGEPAEVVTQTVDVVQLKDLDAVCRYMPTEEYYRAGFQNVTRADIFRVTVMFGIDYSTQKEDVEKIEAAFADGLKHEFKETEFNQFITELKASFHSAGDSSLNYLMLTTFDSDAAYGYNRIKRIINRACVKVCTENDWTIPFPQMSVHVEAEKSSADSKDGAS